MLGQFHIGVMQGRLLSKYKGHYQAHPKGYWQEEFGLANEFSLNLIEFILDFSDALENPLMTPEGLAGIRTITQASGVQVRSICADYFMVAPLHSSNQKTAETSQEVLSELLKNASSIGATEVVIPCVDQSSLKNDEDKTRFIRNIKNSAREAESMGIHLALETDLPPKPFMELLDTLDCPSVTVNYDTGNSASLGHNPEEEFEAYGNRISDIHIKDRVLGGGSVPLGQGDVNFKKIIDFITSSNFTGPIILQAYRDEEGKAIFRKQLDWFRKISGLQSISST
jgi:L-ribulose-5-phosphate 3-epimerase